MWKARLAPGGVKALWPKDDGLTVMISAIASRDLGSGVELLQELMEKVNQYRLGKNTATRKLQLSCTVQPKRKR